ncbi:hypothetical protein TSUD_322800 [Trifolium subterraneum]|uniref:Retrotransposon Copia-like N-terminal domain-containing protein n=1 Tax=Trifolium subterraneum TaxID=3900 RepID=A0A2Z6MGW6_TRISU|nr:hypothetical protein TSUD_322800 [Trifolium subterraneum]
MALLTGYDLISYVDGSKPCPPRVLANNVAAVNLAFTHWVKQDQLILHGVISYVAATVVTHLGTVKNSNQAWEILKTMYVGRSRVRIMALKQRISNFTKGNYPMATYLQGIKAISDKLSIIDHPLDETDLVIHTLNGLIVEYREISAALRSRESPIAFVELHEKLMDFETIHHRADQHVVDVVATANVVARDNNIETTTITTPLRFRCIVITDLFNQAATQNANWVMDTRASHHISQYLQQLTLANSYPGANQVIVGDGTGLKFGSSTAPRST